MLTVRAILGTAKYLFDTEARKKDWYVWLLFVVILVVGPFLASGIYLGYVWLFGKP